MQNVLHRTSSHAALIKQRSGLLDDPLPGFLSFAHGVYKISKKKDASVSFLRNQCKQDNRQVQFVSSVYQSIEL